MTKNQISGVNDLVCRARGFREGEAPAEPRMGIACEKRLGGSLALPSLIMPWTQFDDLSRPREVVANMNGFLTEL